jgi:hypothetical protein
MAGLRLGRPNFHLMQVGIGEGRPDSKVSHCGMGWGTFRVATPKEEKEWLKLK